MHPSRVEVTNLVIASDEEDRRLGTTNGVCQTVNHTDGMLAVVGFGQAVTIKYDEIGRNTFHTQGITQHLIGTLTVVQVVENNAGEVGAIHLWRSELIELGTQGITRMELIGMLHHQVHHTDAVVVLLSGLQVVEGDAVLDIEAYFLSVQQGMLLLQVVRVCSVLHPAMGRSRCLEHHGHLRGLWVLQVRLEGHQLVCLDGQTQGGHKGTMV